MPLHGRMVRHPAARYGQHPSMEIFFDPSTYAALGTLVVLEVVLGIDNLVFIAILAEKLPPDQRDRARVIGLTLALVMRLGLLSAMSWMIGLTQPLFTVLGTTFSGRDCIMLTGGLFLLYKATTELHERLDCPEEHIGTMRNYAGFWKVVAQIVVLDAVFSLDAVITAVGMVESLAIMMIAVSVAIMLMLLASRPLTQFISRHPTLVVLCLSFLLLIGLSLLAEGLGFHIPKGYLYAAIGFSLIIEIFNQIATHNSQKSERKKPFRLRTAQAVIRLLGDEGIAPPYGTPEHTGAQNDQNSLAEGGLVPPDHLQPFSAYASEEVNMVSRVLTLSGRTVRSIMTHRSDVVFLDLDDPADEQRDILLHEPHSLLPVCRGGLDNVLGVARSAHLLAAHMEKGSAEGVPLDEPLIVPETMRVISLLGPLRSRSPHFVLVTDEYGTIEGVITALDFFEAVAGHLAEEGEPPLVQQQEDGSLIVSGAVDVHLLEVMLEIPGLVSETNDYTSLAGFLLAEFGKLPGRGDTLTHEGYTFTVDEVAERRIASVRVKKVE